MKKVKSVIKFLFVVAIVAGLCVPAFAFQAPKAIPGQFIVIFKEANIPPVAKLKLTAANREAKISLALTKRTDVLNKINSFNAKNQIKDTAVLHKFSDALSGFSAKLSQAEVIKLKGQADVAGVYQDFEINLGPIPVSTTAPADFNAAGQTLTCAIMKAGGPVDGSTKSTWIWILDTGINQTHPDLNVQTNPTFAKSFVPGQVVEDGHGHGTHCAGIAAAKNNGIGVVGVSAGAKVVPVKVLSNAGSGSFSWLIAALNHVAANDVPGDVVSMSLGAYPVSSCASAMPPLNAAIANLTAAGTHVVIAAGNNGSCTGAASCLPGCINQTRLYTVGALNCDLTRASYSNFGQGTVDWVAVGSNVYSTYKNGGYATMSGTSMATPVVAGVIHARGGAPIGGQVNVAGCGLYGIAQRQ